jgi:thymidine phosphorylase
MTDDSPSVDLPKRVEDWLRQTDFSDAEVAAMACELAESGDQLDDQGEAGVGFASTGAPSSLSTLLVPLYLRALQYRVPSLGVPGRPAGAMDVLASIPGYRIDLNREEVRTALEVTGLVHFTAGKRWTPADARLFASRQRVGAQARPVLVIASLLAKKLAVGVTKVGIDIRVGRHGNFGRDQPSAFANARRLRAVAELLGLQAECVLTDATFPYQPFIGRGEALLALNDVISGETNDWLASHDELCWRITVAVARRPAARRDSRPLPHELRTEFEANLQAQGTDMSAFERRVDEIASANTVAVRGERAGHLCIDLAKLRDAVVAHQATGAGEDLCGVTLLAQPGDLVERGEIVASVRVHASPRRSSAVSAVSAAFSIETRTSLQRWDPVRLARDQLVPLG